MTRDAHESSDRFVLKHEPCTHIEVDRSRVPPRFVKTYRVPWYLRWRTVAQPSRSAREFANLRAALHAQVPCVEPVSFAESRGFGCVRESTVELVYDDRLVSVRELLRGYATRPADPKAIRNRTRCARGIGRLLRCMHEAGIQWGTVTPRNVMARQGKLGRRATFFACDMPNAIRYPESIVGSRVAAHDLYDAAFSPGRRDEFRATDRLRAVLAYTGGDREAAREIWRRLASWPRWWQRLQKACLRVTNLYLFGWLRGRFAPGAAPRKSS